MTSFLLSVGGMGTLSALAIPYDTMNKAIIVANPIIILDDTCVYGYPISADNIPASMPRPTRIQNTLSSPLFTLDSSVAGWPCASGGVSFVLVSSDFFSSFFFGCLTK